MPSEHPTLLTSRDFLRARLNDRALRRGAERGDYAPVVPGVFVPMPIWATLTPRLRHVTRARAVAPRLGSCAVFSHVTAAALHGLPLLGEWPELVEATDSEATRTRRGRSLRTHALPLAGSDLAAKEALPVTAPGRTLVDLAISLPLRDAVVSLDGALHAAGDETPALLAAFDEALERREPIREHLRVGRVRRFIDGAAESPGESLSRVVMQELGWPPPVLQESFFDAAGKIGTVDFWWPQFGVIGEFDGLVKYERAEFLNGMTPAQVVAKEKRREDRLRA
ncbi:MAG: hypothetical protein JWP75_730, partial [Frondihabitans sp.]|nr:hypothetical protein [Frondihabitans sp.]